MKRYLVLFGVLLCLFTNVLPVKASGIGVGIGTGKISINEQLKNGMTYLFPDVVVINTGDRESQYTVDISYDQDQKELLPPREWFVFSPEVFNLKPGESQNVSVKLKLPIDNVIPGDYFSYLEASPIIANETGMATVGIAAAAKLSFTIAPSNFFEGIFYTLKYIFLDYQPWSTVVVSVIVLIVLRTIFVKFFSIDFNIKTKKKKDNEKINE